MKVIMYVAVSRDGYIAGKYDDTSRVSQAERQQFSRTVNGIGNMIVGRRTHDIMTRDHEFDKLDDPFVVVMSKRNQPSQPNRHFTHAKPKNILKFLDEKWWSSTVIAGWIQINRLFLEQWLVDQLIVDEEPVEVGEGLKFDDMMPDNISLELVREYEYSPGHKKKIYISNNDTSSHSG